MNSIISKDTLSILTNTGIEEPNTVGEDEARLEEIQERAKSLEAIAQENAQKIKKQQEEVKRFGKKIEKLFIKHSELKLWYDNNINVYNKLLSARREQLRNIDKQIKERTKLLNKTHG